jgi:hypothetical protein
VANYGGESGTGGIVVYAFDPASDGTIEYQPVYSELYPKGSGVNPDGRQGRDLPILLNSG